ncbi:hypothetical protein ACFY1B_28975 [Streptomyces mirabilis]|uniref:hypothetical protein n=1 Tax=Streptomyces mirabilis TaxID=68239 RepID=UPI003695E0C3
MNNGVHQNADVWLNGVHLGFLPCGYTAFADDLPPHLGHTWLTVRGLYGSRSGAFT